MRGLLAVAVVAALGWGCRRAPARADAGVADGAVGKAAPEVEAGVERFVVLSDIHAFAAADGGPAAGGAAAVCPPSGESRCVGCAAGDSDTKGPLFGSLLVDLACALPTPPRFAIVSGDWIAHTYGASGGQAGLKRGIVQAATEALVRQWGGQTLLVPALGNNDAYAGDYNLEPEGAFLRDMAALWGPLFPPEAGLGACTGVADPAAFSGSFMAGGYYAFTNPHLPNNCTLVLNTVMFTPKFVGSSFAQRGTLPGAAQLDWLEARLAAAEAAGRRVWLVYHVPPGVDAFSSARGCAAVETFTGPFAERFGALVVQYADVIEAAFAGHSHLDDFRLVAGPGGPVSWVHVAPSVTPDHHPGRSAWQLFDYRAVGGRAVIEGYVTRRVDFSAGGSGVWGRSYDWRSTFCPGCRYALASLVKVDAALGADPVAGAYRRVVGLGVPGEGAPGVGECQWPAYRCAVGEGAAAAFGGCVAAAGQPAGCGCAR